MHDGEVLDGVRGDVAGDAGDRVDHHGDHQTERAERVEVLGVAGQRAERPFGTPPADRHRDADRGTPTENSTCAGARNGSSSSTRTRVGVVDAELQLEVLEVDEARR